MNNNSEDIYADDSSRRTVACISCFAPNAGTTDFCQNCGAPLGDTSTLDPIKSIRAEGFMLQKAAERRPKLIVLIGIWIIFLPWSLAAAFLALEAATGGQGFSGFFFFWAGIALAFFAGRMLFVVTNNYLTMPDVSRDVEVEAENMRSV